MTTAASDPQIVPRPPAAAPALCAADRGVADALTSVLSDHTRRVYGAQWRLFNEWCGGVDLRALPAEPSPWPATWPPVPAPAPVLPPCAWRVAPSRRYTNGPAKILPAGTGACARR